MPSSSPIYKRPKDPRSRGRHTGPHKHYLRELYKHTGGVSTLTDRQQAFVKCIVKGNNATAAARAAGYSGKTANVMGHKLIIRPDIQYAIAKERVEMQRLNAMTKKRVMDGFLDAIEMARTKADPIGMIGGWREVARMCGYYEPVKHKLQVSVEGKIIVDKLQRLTDEELVRLAEGDSSIIDVDYVEEDEVPVEQMTEDQLKALSDESGEEA